MASGKLEKAFFKVTPATAGGLAKTELRCRYNPTSITTDGSAEYKSTVGKGYKSAPKVEFVGVKSRNFKTELFLDGRETGSLDVFDDVTTLLSWLKPTPDSISTKKPRPPTVVFHWGKKQSFDAHLVSVSAKYEMFDRSGVPIRARVSIELQEAQAEVPKTNPSSGGLAGNRTHTVTAGDSLHSIAQSSYGSPSFWRGLAAYNEIDDPFRMAPGRELLVPPLDDVVALS